MADKVDLSGFDDVVKNYDLSGFDKEAPASSEYSMLGAGALGAAKGATLGFDDEIAGVAMAATKKLGGSEQDFWDIYRNIRDNVRKEHATAEEQQPISSFAGELVGGLAVPGGIVGKGAIKGASFAQKALAMAKTGAKAGAVAGLGSSKADLTTGEPEQLGEAAKDIAGGAVLGAGTGVGMQALGSTLSAAGSSVANVANKFPMPKDIMEVFKRTKNGEELLGKVNEFSQANRDLARGIIDDLEGLRNLAGKFKGGQLEEIEKSGVKIKVDDLVDTLQTKLEGMSSPEASEQADIDKFRQVLKNIVKDEKKEIVSFVPKAKPPVASAEEKAAAKVAKKTAEAEAKDQIKMEELRNELNDLVANNADNDEMAPVIEKMSKLRNATQYPPQNIAEPLTGLDVQGVSRGLHKTPITEAVPAAQESLFTPIERKVTEVPTRGVTEVTPTELDKIVKSLQSTSDAAETHVGRGLAQDTRSALRNRLQETVDASTNPDVKAAQEGLKASIEGVKNTARAQERLGLPGYFSGTANPEKAKTEAINKLQRAIQETQKPGSMGKQVVDEAMSELEKAFPGSSERIKREIMEGSRKEYLTRELSKESALSKDPTTLYASGKSLALLGSRAAGKVANKLGNAVTPETASKKMVDLGHTVYSADPSTIERMAQAAGGMSKNISNTLNKIAQHGDQGRRRALLFTLMQQPEFRQFAHDFFSKETPNE